tara:strand:+ start:895 stop:1212 length:318 start_codon:yes stop_codon:yes gene_type:complete
MAKKTESTSITYTFTDAKECRPVAEWSYYDHVAIRLSEIERAEDSYHIIKDDTVKLELTPEQAKDLMVYLEAALKEYIKEEKVEAAQAALYEVHFGDKEVADVEA